MAKLSLASSKFSIDLCHSLCFNTTTQQIIKAFGACGYAILALVIEASCGDKTLVDHSQIFKHHSGLIAYLYRFLHLHSSGFRNVHRSPYEKVSDRFKAGPSEALLRGRSYLFYVIESQLV